MFGRITIRTTILTNMLLVLFLVAGSLLALQYRFSFRMASEATQKSFSESALGITLRLKERDRLARSILHELAYDRSFIRLHTPFPHETIRRFTYTMKHFPKIYAINLGNPFGDLFEVVNVNRPDLREIYRTPPRTRWIAVHIHDTSKGRVKRYDFLDEDLKRIFSRSESTDFDVTTRAWYLEALKNDGVCRIGPYRFENLGKRGITYSKSVGDSHTVIAVDLTSTELDELFAEQVFVSGARIFMFDRNGSVVASSHTGIGKVERPMREAVERGRMDSVFVTKVDGSERFTMVTEFSGEGEAGSYLGFSVPVETMMAPYIRDIYYAFGVAFAVLILSLPFVFFTASRIVGPIKALMRENGKIKARRYDDVKPVRTRIVEMVELSDSLVSMSKSIRNYEETLKRMIRSFIEMIAEAIDAKSPYTGGHCRRVPVLARMLAKAANDSEEGAFRNFRFEDDEAFEAFELGTWLHDCGKITTPEFVVDKATKLETIYNRIHEIRTRFEVIWRDVEIEFYRRVLDGEDRESLERWREEERKRLREDFAFIAACNEGREFMREEEKRRIRAIAERKWTRYFDDRLGLSEAERRRYPREGRGDPPVEESLLADRIEHIVPRSGFDSEEYEKDGFRLRIPEHLYNFGEIYNLCIEKGTLTEEERFKIEEHVVMTIRMLEKLPYPPGMERISEYAGTHHETLDGTGYPRGLTAEHLSIPARIVAIADIFEALTASDRPYKKRKTLSESLRIMGYMVREGHLDREVFTLFLKTGIYEEYAKKYLEADQIDEVDIDGVLKESTITR
ncbi:HD domain-containing phosphohydrolase [Hydrogenimonas sp.]